MTLEEMWIQYNIYRVKIKKSGIYKVIHSNSLQE